jgi:hypothetical protein
VVNPIRQTVASWRGFGADNCYIKVISINPNRFLCLADLGIAYATMPKLDDAKKFIQRGLSMPSI